MLVAEASLTRYLDLFSFSRSTQPRYGAPWLLYWLGVIGWSLLLLQVPEYIVPWDPRFRTSQVPLVNSGLGSGRHYTVQEPGYTLPFHLNANLVGLQAGICLDMALGLPEGLWHGQDGQDGQDGIRKDLSGGS